MTDTDTARDWRSTVFLPKTDFPMKAGLPQKEPGILARWQAEGSYAQLRAARAGREKFILHDGPPYANGDMHIGHALNHILKDMVVRTQTLLGKDAPYVPGWDCHGLPIEWKVEEAYRKKKLDKPVPSAVEGDESALREFRAECRAYAQAWVDVQREQLKRLGIGGDWDRPYLTMDFDSEATIVAELMKFAESGQLYRGAKPVMWSPVERTALAEAEVEYEDIVSTQIDVAFEIVESPIPELVGAHAVIWTTTPWTTPVNQAIAYGPEVEYRLFQIGVSVDGLAGVDVFEHPTVKALQGRRVLMADSKVLRSEFDERLRNMWPEATLIDSDEWHGKGSDLADTVACHPMYHLGGFFAKPRRFLPGDFVTTEQGTGLVHMAPDHGEDDFDLCKANGIDPVFAVEGDGKYRADWAWLGGQGSVINAKFNAPDGPICTDLREAGALLAASADYKHSYPHSWRSKAKLIFRATPQWFIAMDQPLPPPQGGGYHAPQAREGEGYPSNGQNPAYPLPGAARLSLPPEGEGGSLRQRALTAIAATRWFPPKGQNRITAMVEGRPDWVISRQRAWGVPIALFVERRTGQYLVDAAVNARIVAAFREQGVDAWTDANAAHFLGAERDPADYERVTDILDVWFDSGCTHAFVLESGKWPELRWPADLYLEGSDQHRGWFQSSLMESCATRGRAPYDAVLTHGFTMASDGRKMSKSLGNTIDPLKLMEEYGADILRLWALSVDFTEDHRIGKEILGTVADQYRKLRNTFRYLLGALDGWDEGERVEVDAMPGLERYVLQLLADLDARLRTSAGDYDFNSYVRLLTDFANNDLSAFYLDIRKDSLYCDAPSSLKRRACRTVLDTLFHALVRWAAPVLVFTSEEVWGTRYPHGGSVHLLEWPAIGNWGDAPLFEEWTRLRDLRLLVSAEIEPLRRAKELGSSLQADVTLGISDVGDRPLLTSEELAELFIVADVGISTVEHGPVAIVHLTKFDKCGRCWRHLPEVAEDGALCARCEEVVA